MGDALRSLGFSSPAAAGELPPAQQAEALKQELQREEQELRDVKGQLAAQAGTRESLLLAADSCGAKAESFREIILWTATAQYRCPTASLKNIKTHTIFSATEIFCLLTIR